METWLLAFYGLLLAPTALTVPAAACVYRPRSHEWRWGIVLGLVALHGYEQAIFSVGTARNMEDAVFWPTLDFTMLAGVGVMNLVLLSAYVFRARLGIVRIVVVVLLWLSLPLLVHALASPWKLQEELSWGGPSDWIYVVSPAIRFAMHGGAFSALLLCLSRRWRTARWISLVPELAPSMAMIVACGALELREPPRFRG